MPENRTNMGGLRDQAGRFLPGQSGNPGGRPKSAVISEALREKLGQEVNGSTRAELVAEKAIELAELGSVRSLKLIADRTEGRVPQTINLGRAGAVRKSYVEMRSSMYYAMTEEERRSAFAGIKVYLTGEDGKSMFDAWDPPAAPALPEPLFEPEDPPLAESHIAAETYQEPPIPSEAAEPWPRTLPAEDRSALVRAAAEPELEQPPFLRARVPPGMHAEETEVDGMKVKRYVINPPAEKTPSLWDL